GPPPREALAAERHEVDLVRRRMDERDAIERSGRDDVHAPRLHGAGDWPDHDPERGCRRRILTMFRSAVLLLVLAVSACGTKAAATAPPPCDGTCQDGIAIRALRETAKLAFNLTLQGKPVGQHDETTPCPLGGSVHVFGVATSNAVQGATEVDLTYV